MLKTTAYRLFFFIFYFPLFQSFTSKDRLLYTQTVPKQCPAEQNSLHVNNMETVVNFVGKYNYYILSNIQRNDTQTKVIFNQTTS